MLNDASAIWGVVIPSQQGSEGEHVLHSTSRSCVDDMEGHAICASVKVLIVLSNWRCQALSRRSFRRESHKISQKVENGLG